MGKNRNLLWALLGCAVLNAFPATARNYEKMWKKVIAFQQNDLPQSALKSARTIFKQAMDDNNKGEMLKAYLFMLQLRQSLSIDSLQPDMKRLESMTATSRDSVEKAVMHSLLGVLYTNQVYNGKSGSVATPVSPSDMSEWTRPMYRENARRHFVASLSNPSLLSHTSMVAYIPVIEKGNTDNYLGDNLLHVITRTAVDNMDANTDSTLVRTFYDNLIHYYTAEGNRNAVVLVTLEKLEADYRRRGDGEAYRKAVELLIAGNPNAETCAEAYIALAGKDELWLKRRAMQLAFVREGLAAFPKYRRIGALKEMEERLLKPYLRISQQNAGDIVPGKPFDIECNWGNTNSARLDFYRVRDGYSNSLQKDFADFTSSFDSNGKSKNAFLMRYTGGKPLLSQTYTLGGKAYELNDSTIKAPALPAGIYIVHLTSANAIEAFGSYALIAVSGLRTLSQNVYDGRKTYKEVRIVDAISGKPRTDASLVFYDDAGKETTRLAADKEGIVRTDSTQFNFRAVAPTDNYALMDSGNTYSYNSSTDIERHVVQLYTDRTVYRPGQTVQVAGIAYRQTADTMAVESGKPLTVKLVGANSRPVGEKEVTTGSYGSFSCGFVLPASGLTGVCTLMAGSERITVRVEEYKRPTFEVSLEKPVSGYKAGDSIAVIGIAKTYAGVPLQNARVTYTVNVRQGWWRNYANLPQPVSGTATTDSEGRFIVPVRLAADLKGDVPYWWYNYVVHAQVLSAAGETQEGSLTLPLSNRSLYVSVDGVQEGNNVLKENGTPVIIHVANLNGTPVDCRGTYMLVPVKDGKPQGKGIEKPFTANETSIAPDFQKLPSGSYRLIATVMDKSGEVKDTVNFVLYSEADVRPPVHTAFWHEVISDEMSPSYASAPEFAYVRGKKGVQRPAWTAGTLGKGKTAVIKVGSSLQDVCLFYRLYAGNRCIDDRKIFLSDSILTFRYAYKPEYKEGLKATFAFVKDGKIYNSSDRIGVVQPDKQLSIAWGTFRDKLTPGQKENWTMYLTRNDNRPFDGAEVMATMYDASLDGLYPAYRWSSIPYGYLWKYPFNGGYVAFGNTTEFPYLNVLFRNKAISWKYSPLTYSKLNAMALPGGSFSPMYRSRGQLLMGGVEMSSLAANKAMDSVAVPMAQDTESNVFNYIPKTVGGTSQSDRQPLRSDFNETAFFYPHLQTDNEGKVTIAFTLPDALTKWKFRALAHTRDMLSAVTDTTVTASKDFMVQPNLPRYVRYGDTASFPATLTNLAGKAFSGTARMEIIDPDTQRILYTESQQFKLDAGKTYGLNFKWKADGTRPVVICRIQAGSGKLSDGEQSYVSVLSDTERVTESIALAVNGESTVTYDLKRLFAGNDPAAKDRRLTVEFTSNPVWYAIQALPTMAEATDNDALSLSSAYYADAMAAYICGQYPKLKQVFDRWRAEGKSGESLWSNLQKNPSLKTIVLNETPWLAEAESEAERKQRLSTLFDVNSLAYKQDAALRRLGALQMPDGGWSWFKGMQSNDYVTLSVAGQLARLEKMTGGRTAAHPMLEKALSYLSKEVTRRYGLVKKDKKAYDTDSFVLRTFYLQSLAGQLKNDECTRFYLDSWTEHPTGMVNEDKARLSIVLRSAGRSGDADNCLKSLMEHTVQTKELGRYFDNTSFNYCYWDDRRIPTQTLVIEALKTAGGYSREIAEMSQWLLKQKQAQAWANPVQSANSVYALLIGNASQTLAYQSPATVTLNGKTVQSDKETAALGYIHALYTGGDAVDRPSSLTITKASQGIGWGGVYAQYTLPLEKITSTAPAAGSGNLPLSIRREFYVKRVENGKTVRLPLSETNVKVGDCLISHLVVKLDRDMEFIQVKDGRMACAEPANAVSGYRSNGDLSYYEAPGDASTRYFCDRLGKGTYIIENESYIDRAGDYMSGSATVQCAYAPEFTASAAPVHINVR